MDTVGLLRMGGRLSQSQYSFDKRFPILIEKSGHLAWLLISKSHHQSLHSGTQQTLATLQQRYWIINDRSQVRKYVRSCVKCFKFFSKSCEQKMGDLPEERVSPSRPFTFTGIDFAGPLIIKGISKTDEKAFIALFVCFSTRAIHLECVSLLLMEACLAAIRRFTSRRDFPHHLQRQCDKRHWVWQRDTGNPVNSSVWQAKLIEEANGQSRCALGDDFTPCSPLWWLVRSRCKKCQTAPKKANGQYSAQFWRTDNFTGSNWGNS